VVYHRPVRRHRSSAVLALLFTLVALGACKRSARSLDLDQPRLDAEMGRRFSAAVERPEVSKAFDDLMAKVGADPAVAQAGSSLTDALGADAGIRDSANAIIASFGSSPAVQQLAARIMSEHPDATPDQVGELASQRIATITDGPRFKGAWERAWNELMKTPEVTGVLARLGGRLSKSDGFTSAIDAAVRAKISEQRVSDRLTELNGGQSPDAAKATDLLLQHAFAVERLARFYQDVLALPAVTKAIGGLAHDLAASPAFQKIAVDGVAGLLSDATVRAQAAALMTALLTEDVTEDQLYQALQPLLMAPAMRKALVSTLDRMLAEPELGAISTRTLLPVMTDPAFVSAFARIFEGW